MTFHLEARDFSYWSSTAARLGARARRVHAGDRRLLARPAADRPRLTLPRRCGRSALDAMASLEEWLADPAGAPVLREVVGTDETGRPRGILGDHELRAVVGNFPIGALTAFPGSGLDQGERRRASPTVARPSRSLNAATSTTTLPPPVLESVLIVVLRCENRDGLPKGVLPTRSGAAAGSARTIAHRGDRRADPASATDGMRGSGAAARPRSSFTARAGAFQWASAQPRAGGRVQRSASPRRESDGQRQPPSAERGGRTPGRPQRDHHSAGVLRDPRVARHAAPARAERRRQASRRPAPLSPVARPCAARPRASSWAAAR